ncbi:ribosomal RNA small subunit methyltransferase B [Rothia aeria]|uniref:Ribosomal RNA small subunit methyltransferase B n=1 Tax=Rothia aeria TaxID=172042 RepID=A0A2Z5R1V2_9MICC|nr:ribosomal RNA small subunit methyltransferase B [Rothia aeria]
MTCSPHAAETQNIVAEALESGKVHLLDARTALQAVALQESGSGEPGMTARLGACWRGRKTPEPSLRYT